ncbi:MAG: CPA2 family monovalent cation:H+ antiporter-2 [Myxococcota bacterium]|jgi:CPA2 family monovalent cation:H+ antiporter-2
MHSPAILTDLALVLGVAGVTAVIARRLNQPSILGFLFAGLIVGPYPPVPLFADPHQVGPLAELGVVLVMFAIGLELRLKKLARLLPVAGLTAIIQIGVMIWAGYSLGQAIGWSPMESIFLGAAICISSTMVVSRVFVFVDVEDDVKDLVLGILVIQDIAAVVLIAAMSTVAAGGGLSPEELGVTLMNLGGVLLGLVLTGVLVVPAIFRYVHRLGSPEIVAVFSIGLAFTFAFAAAWLGYSVALGAFIAGVSVAESGEGKSVEHTIAPIRDVFSAIFFVSIGMTVDPSDAIDNFPVSALVAVGVIVAQLVAVTIGGILSGNGIRRSASSGLALGQIGEFGFILGAIGVTAGRARPELQSVLVTAAVLTTFTTPVMLRMAPRVVSVFTRGIPTRIKKLLEVYETWLAAFRGSRGPRNTRPVYRAALLIGLDLIGLLVLLSVTVKGLPWAARWLAGLSGADEIGVGIGIIIVALIAASPLFIGLARNSFLFVRLVGELALRDPTAPPTTTELVVAHTLRLIVTIGLVLGLGVPTMVVLRPLTGGFYAVVTLLVVLAALTVYVWRRAAVLESELQSGASRVAKLLSRVSDAGSDEPSDDEQPVEIQPVVTALLHVHGNAVSVGQPLRNFVSLWASSGLTVVSLHRSEGVIARPPADDTILAAGDLIEVCGTEAAVRAAARGLDTETATDAVDGLSVEPRPV